ncbi:MAG: AAA family ATPase [Ignavibacteriales bacterium]|nr:AAA family ATPase [Ignavibacteriales bacterium]
MPQRINNPLWLKAALLGSTWASVEIILGSFLHNLRVPFVGALLAANGAALLIAGHRLWPERGLLWRAGVICALMKSISPSGFIFGPMIGIASEGLLLDLLMRLVGSSGLAVLLSAGVVVTLPLFHSIINLLILYGFDIARLYVELYNLAAKNLRIESLSAVELIWVFAAGHFMLGLVAGGLGVAVGRRIVGLPASAESRRTATHSVSAWLNDARGSFSIGRLIFHIAALIGALLVVRSMPVWSAAALVLVYSAGCFTLYPHIRRRFSRIRLWVEFAAVTALSGLLLKGIGHHAAGWQWEGLMLGFQMTLRAMLVIVAFSAIGHELRNPVILAWMLQRGLGNLTAALEVAFQTLPTMITALGEEKNFFRHPTQSLARMLATAAGLLPEIQRHGSSSRVIVVVGEQGSGKTTFVMRLADALHRHNISVGGIAAPGTWKDGMRTRFDVVDLATREQKQLCALEGIHGSERIGPFIFSDEGLQLGKRALSDDALRNCRVVIVDEVGPLELAGHGWASVLDRVVKRNESILLITVRPSVVESVRERWNLNSVDVWKVDDTKLDDAIQEVMRRM